MDSKKKYLKPTWKILEKYSKKYFFSVTNFGNQNISKSTLEVYFIFRIYTEVYLKYSYISAGQNTNKSLHNLWNNGLVVRVQIYQTKDPRFKTISWLKNYFSFHPSNINLMNTKDSWGLGVKSKSSHHSESVACRQLNYMHKMVHWDK